MRSSLPQKSQFPLRISPPPPQLSPPTSYRFLFEIFNFAKRMDFWERESFELFSFPQTSSSDTWRLADRERGANLNSSPCGDFKVLWQLEEMQKGTSPNCGTEFIGVIFVCFFKLLFMSEAYWNIRSFVCVKLEM